MILWKAKLRQRVDYNPNETQRKATWDDQKPYRNRTLVGGCGNIKVDGITCLRNSAKSDRNFGDKICLVSILPQAAVRTSPGDCLPKTQLSAKS